MENVRAAFLVQQSSGSTPQQLREANTWLESFQSTREAWTVADQLLSLTDDTPADNANSNGALTALNGGGVANGASRDPLLPSLHVFAAQTMRTKIVYDWAELPKESHAALRGSLLAHVVRFGQGPGPVLTQLCLAVATMALHMDEWRTVVPDLIQALTTPAESATTKLPCLLELLTVLPEEAENFKVAVLPKQREAFRQAVSAAGEQVLQLLGQVHAQCSTDLSLMNRTLRTLASWLRHASLPPSPLLSSPLLPFAFAATASPELFDAAADALVELVHYAHNGNAPEQLVGAVLPEVLKLQAQYDAARWEREDEDEARALCRIFTEMGEQYLHLLLTQRPEWALQTAAAVLRGASHPDPEIAEMTFNFWYILSEEIAGSGRALTEAQKTEYRQQFSETYLRLLEALRALAQFPPDSDSWHADRKDDFKRFRYAVGDVISDSCKVLSATRCLEHAYGTLSSQLPAFAADTANQWRPVEACVFCMRQMVSSNDPAFFTADVVSKMMQLLPTLPAVGELTNTCIRTVGTYANWLNRNPEGLTHMLTFVSQGLANDATSAAASQAMKHLCDACSEHLADASTVSQLIAMHVNTISLPLHCADRVDLIAALSFVLSQLELPSILPAMHAVADPLITKLSGYLAPADGARHSAPTEVANLLEQICALLRGVSPTSNTSSDLPQMQDAPHPCVQMLQELWQVLAAVFAKHGNDSRVMEKLCRCYKHTARNCGRAFVVLVPQLLPQVTSWFEVHPHSCFIYVCNVLISSFGDTPSLMPAFSEAYQRLSAATFRLLSLTSTIAENPDVVDDYFELSSKVLTRTPSLLLESPPQADGSPSLLVTVFQCGCAAMHIQHREAGRAVVRFFDCLLSQCVETRGMTSVSPASLAALRQLLQAHGVHLVTALIRSIAGVLPHSRVRFLSPVLRKLIRIDPAASRAWTESAVGAISSEVHADGATLVAALFSAEAAEDDKVISNATDAFSAACRRKRVIT